MKQYLAFNANRIIWYNQKDQVVEEWTGGTFQIIKIKVLKSKLYIDGILISEFVPEIEKIDVSMNIPVSDYEIKWMKMDDDTISIKLNFNVEKLLEKEVIEIAPLAYMRGRTLNEAFIILDEAKKFIYVGRDWILAKRRDKLIEIVPNVSKINKLKAIVANTLNI